MSKSLAADAPAASEVLPRTPFNSGWGEGLKAKIMSHDLTERGDMVVWEQVAESGESHLYRYTRVVDGEKETILTPEQWLELRTEHLPMYHNTFFAGDKIITVFSVGEGAFHPRRRSTTRYA